MSVKSLSSSSLTNNVFYRSLLAGSDPFIPFTAADDLLAEVTLTSSASSVSFTGLGAYSDYKHLQLRMVTRFDTSSNDMNYLTFNGDNGSNYSTHRLEASLSTSTVNSASHVSEAYIRIAETDKSSNASGAFGAAVIDILDFSDTNKNTTVRLLSGHTGAGNTTDGVALRSGLWDSTAAVTSIELNVAIAAWFSLVAGSRFSLVGIR